MVFSGRSSVFRNLRASTSTNSGRWLLVPTMVAACLAGIHGLAYADATQSRSAFLQVEKAGSTSDTSGLTLGGTTPIHYRSRLWSTQVGAFWEFYASRFTASAPGNRTYLTSLFGITPEFRFRFDNGLSPWFADAGVGLSYTNKRYQSDTKQFSTQFNFGTNIGVGYTFGTMRDQEVSLRFEHYSNGGYREPNPGENFVELRYSHLF
jgi:lipid A 3-O-deacylase